VNNLQHADSVLRAAMMEQLNYALMAANDVAPKPTAFA
jgi:hypothetical protein